MKILYTATVLSHICQFHLPHMKRLQEEGNEVHVAAHDNLAVKNGLSLKYCDRFIEIPFSRSPASRDNIRAYKLLKKHLEEEHYDCIICNTPMGGIVTRLAAKKTRKSGTKVIYIAHGFHFYKGSSKKNWIVYYPVEKYMSRFCDVLVTINEEDHRLASEKFKKVKVEHINGVGVLTERYHPADGETAHAMREAEGLSDGDFVIVCTGELNENKNQKVLIRAAADLKKEIPGLRILLAGNGPLEEELKKQIADTDTADIVKLLGYRTDLEKIVPASDLIVSCSYREGMPLNIIEGMLCGKPAVASVNRGHSELIEDGVTGCLVKPDDAAAFAEKILGLYRHREKAGEMGRLAFEKAQKYTVDAVGEKISELIRA